MKFKITEAKQVGDNLQVVVSHKDCDREVFGMPLEMAEDNKYVDEIKRILRERINAKKVKIDEKMLNKEIEI